VNLQILSSPGYLGLGFVLVFFALMVVFAFLWRRSTRRSAEGSKVKAYAFREISAFKKLNEVAGLAVEAGERIHLSLGRGGITGLQSASALVGLSVLRRIALAASVSDRPPVASSGEGSLAILSQSTLRNAYRETNADSQYDPTSGQVTGLTPFSYAAGTLPLIIDQKVSASILTGHFGSEVALIADANERRGSLTVAGSDSLPAQAILYATSQEPLIGEELYAAGAYLQAGPMHVASLRAQDILRWLLAGIILTGAILKLAGVL